VASIDKNGILQEDIYVGSPLCASTFVCGKNSNGLAGWKNKYGVSLKNLDSGEDVGASQTPSKKNVKPVPAPVIIPAIDADTEILHLAGKKVAVTGQIGGDGFIVCNGSDFCANETKSCQAWIRSLRAQLVAGEKVKECVFTENVFLRVLQPRQIV